MLLNCGMCGVFCHRVHFTIDVVVLRILSGVWYQGRKMLFIREFTYHFYHQRVRAKLNEHHRIGPYLGNNRMKTANRESQINIHMFNSRAFPPIHTLFNCKMRIGMWRTVRFFVVVLSDSGGFVNLQAYCISWEMDIGRELRREIVKRVCVDGHIWDALDACTRNDRCKIIQLLLSQNEKWTPSAAENEHGEKFIPNQITSWLKSH